MDRPTIIDLAEKADPGCTARFLRQIECQCSMCVAMRCALDAIVYKPFPPDMPLIFNVT